MLCRTCGAKSAVLETRESGEGLRRRRECGACGARWTTVELPYEGSCPVAVMTDVQVAALRGVMGRMHDFVEAIDHSIPVATA